MSHTELRYSSIEDYLGPADNRFFGRGFRRVDHRVTHLSVDPLVVGQGTRAKVTVEYPHDWSSKGKIDIPPHLSTVDMLLLGAQLSEAHLAHACGLDESARTTMWLRKVVIRAGNAPQEDLDGLDGSAKLVSTKELADQPGRHESVYATSVGAMSARYTIQHPIGERAEAGARFATLDDVLGDGAARYFGGGFKDKQQHVEDVVIDMAELRGSAAVRLEPVAGSVPHPAGLEGAWQPSVSMVDCFVIDLQLAQVLMYEMDSVQRRDSNTLWMVRTVLESTAPDRPYPAPLATTVAVTGKELIPLRGATWRNVEIAGECGGVRLKCSFTHQLPVTASAAS